jgi:hypothetical protein
LVVNSSERALKVEYWSLSSLAQCGTKPHFIIRGTRAPSTDRMATSIGAVGGLFQSAAKFGAGAAASNFNLILISEKSDESRTRPHMDPIYGPTRFCLARAGSTEGYGYSPPAGSPGDSTCSLTASFCSLRPAL